MAMTENEFKAAFRTAVASEFAHIPAEESEIDYVFSSLFRKKMEKLIHSQKKFYYALLNNGFKKATVAVLIALIVGVSACNTGPPDKQFAGYIIRDDMYLKAYNFYPLHDEEKSNKEFAWDHSSAGFAEVKQWYDNLGYYKRYENDRSDSIEVLQRTHGVQAGHDNDFAECLFETVSGIEVFLRLDDSRSPEREGRAVFYKDSYYYKIEWQGDVEMDVIYKLIRELE